jgi:hypothetical protein
MYSSWLWMIANALGLCKAGFGGFLVAHAFYPEARDSLCELEFLILRSRTKTTQALKPVLLAPIGVAAIATPRKARLFKVPRSFMLPSLAAITAISLFLHFFR